ncbi:MAG: phosphoribosylamine--glycine ligase [Cyclobacteriaceae bacterium]|nr:phosphoribosylamine--glycine ligase [Cyclobacteriaceae bacterium]
MNVLILGSGGREHAIAWKVKQSPKCQHLFVAPGNGGTHHLATNLDFGVNDFKSLKENILLHQIDMVIVGPEDPLVNGVVDFIKSDPALMHVKTIGPSKEGAQLEGSKDFAKQFMLKYGIPTADARVFDADTLQEGKDFLKTIKPPYVLKADGLAAGKGVIITESLPEAQKSLEELISGKFGDASANVLVEEFLSGIELSVFALTDGVDYVILPEAKDYKRIGEGDKGPNTGGMGAVSPVGFADDDFMKKVEEKIIRPTIEGIQNEGFDYRGFVFFGLIKVGDEPFVIEYNVRMGDPETEVVMPRIASDFLETLEQAAVGQLAGASVVKDQRTATTVMMVAEGYPGSYDKGRDMHIGMLPPGSLAFHAGTKQSGEKIQTNGGRVIALTGLGNTLGEALEQSYAAVKNISWQGAGYRADIGFDLKRLGQ